VSVDEIVCREFAELATEYLEGAIPDPTLELVEEHLAMCDWCRDYLHQIRTTARAVAAEPEAGGAGPPTETLDGLMAAFRSTTKGKGAP
jgi:predicted anti-sigma-YlaC factor YlaD